MDFMSGFVSQGGYLPHGYCFSWTPGLLWSMVGADGLIALAYFSIPLAIGSFIRKRTESSWNWMAWMFSAFIFACGLTHLMDVWTIWRPDYGVQVLSKIVAAVISAVTAVALWRLIPVASKVPSVEQLQSVIDSLAAEVEKVNRADRKFRDLLESSPDAKVIIDGTGSIVLVNIQTVNLFGWTHEELLGQPLEMLLPERFRATHSLHRSGFFSHPEVRQMGLGLDLYGLRKDGSEFPIEVSLSPILTEDGLLIASSIRDATERKRSAQIILDAGRQEAEANAARKLADSERLARKVLEQSLREKEVLLKEIHHRVKNNLQVISSVLQLQSDYLEGDETRRVFDEGRSRIRSMALVHEKLYQSPDLARIDFGEYLGELVAGLIGSYQTLTSRVSVEVNADSVLLDVDRAIPCGLMVNELVSNSFKHAFPNGRTGRIEILLSGGENAPIELMVSDDGVGWSQTFNPAASKSLGLQLIHLLANQLKASMQLRNENGIRCTLTLAPEPQQA